VVVLVLDDGPRFATKKAIFFFIIRGCAQGSVSPFDDR
jgi:hypothetical protein